MKSGKHEENEKPDAEKARKTLDLNQSDAFGHFRQFVTETADDYRLAAEVTNCNLVHRRIQLLDMAKGLDKMLEQWDDSVEMANDVLTELAE